MPLVKSSVMRVWPWLQFSSLPWGHLSTLQPVSFPCMLCQAHWTSVSRPRLAECLGAGGHSRTSVLWKDSGAQCWVYCTWLGSIPKSKGGGRGVVRRSKELCLGGCVIHSRLGRVYSFIGIEITSREEETFLPGTASNRSAAMVLWKFYLNFTDVEADK